MPPNMKQLHRIAKKHGISEDEHDIVRQEFEDRAKHEIERLANDPLVQALRKFRADKSHFGLMQKIKSGKSQYDDDTISRRFETLAHEFEQAHPGVILTKGKEHASGALFRLLQEGYGEHAAQTVGDLLKDEKFIDEHMQDLASKLDAAAKFNPEAHGGGSFYKGKKTATVPQVRPKGPAEPPGAKRKVSRARHSRHVQNVRHQVSAGAGKSRKAAKATTNGRRFSRIATRSGTWRSSRTNSPTISTRPQRHQVDGTALPDATGGNGLRPATQESDRRMQLGQPCHGRAIEEGDAVSRQTGAAHQSGNRLERAPGQAQFAGPVHLRVAGQHLLDQGRPRSRQAEDEHRPARLRAGAVQPREQVAIEAAQQTVDETLVIGRGIIPAIAIGLEGDRVGLF